MMQSEPMLLNIPVEDMASYIRAQLSNAGCELPAVPMPPVEAWNIE
jgi:hypothetical protein